MSEKERRPQCTNMCRLVVTFNRKSDGCPSYVGVWRDLYLSDIKKCTEENPIINCVFRGRMQ